MLVPRLIRIICVLLALLWMLPVVAQEQTGQQQSSQPEQQQPSQQDEQDQAPTFKVNVNVVNLYFNVKDKHGALIPDLKKEDSRSLKKARHRRSSTSM